MDFDNQSVRACEPVVVFGQEFLLGALDVDLDEIHRVPSGAREQLLNGAYVHVDRVVQVVHRGGFERGTCRIVTDPETQSTGGGGYGRADDVGGETVTAHGLLKSFEVARVGFDQKELCFRKL